MLSHHQKKGGEDVDLYLYLIEYLAQLISPSPKETQSIIKKRRERAKNRDKSKSEDNDDKNNNLNFVKSIFDRGGEKALKEIFGKDYEMPESLKNPPENVEELPEYSMKQLTDDDQEIVTDLQSALKQHYTDEQIEDLRSKKPKPEPEVGGVLEF